MRKLPESRDGRDPSIRDRAGAARVPWWPSGRYGIRRAPFVLAKDSGEPMSEHIVTLTSSNFESEVKKPGAPILVDFWAEWCGPCRMVAPVLEKLADELQGRVRLGKVNVDEESSLAGRYGIQSIPTLLLFKEGKVVDQYIGATTRDILVKMLQKHGV